MPNNQSLFKIIVVEDDQNLAFLIKKRLSRKGFDVTVVNSGEEALNTLKIRTFSLLLMDYKLVDFSSKEIILKLHESGIKIPFIIMTGFGDEKIAVEMMKLGAYDYLVKDQNFLEILVPVVEKAKEKIELGLKLNEAKNNLYKSEIRFRNLIENSSDLITIIDKDGFVNYQSPSIRSILGYNPEDFLGKNLFEYIHSEDKIRLQNFFEEIKNNNASIRSTLFRIKSYDRTFHFLEGTFNNLLANTEINGILLNLRDVTERIIAEDQISRLSVAIEQSPVSIIITDTNARIEYVNPHFTQVSGYKQEEIIGKTPSVFNSGNTPRSIYKSLWESITNGKSWRGEIQNKSKSGKLYWESVSISPVLNKNNQITHYIAAQEDITEKKLNEQKLKKANEFYLTLLEDSPTMIWRCNKEGVRDYFNKTWLKFKGCSLDEELDQNWKNGIHPDDIEKYLTKFNNALEKREPLVSTFRLKQSTNEYRWIKEFAKPFHDLDGYFSGFIGTCLDITENIQAEEAMRIAKEKAEKSEQLKTEFLAQMSHEIRTPINAILSFTSLLKYDLEDKVDDDIKESFDIIDSGGRRLIRTVDLLLHMSEIQTGNYSISIKKLNLIADVIKSILSEMKNFASSKNIKFELLVQDDINDEINVDENSIIQIVENLIDNAIKYNKDNGKVIIEVFNVEEKNICFKITDTGIGIAKEYLPKLFEPFSQEDSGYTRKFEGNGLGLSLVKNYSKIINAKISVNSEKGKGSTFTVVFPRNC